MFSAEQYRAKAAEFRALLTNMPRSPDETRELRNLEQTYTTLAENEEWMAINIGKTVQRGESCDEAAHAALIAPSDGPKPTGEFDRRVYRIQKNAHDDDHESSEQIDPIFGMKRRIVGLHAKPVDLSHARVICAD
jgi:hypothetical protein